MINYHLPKGSNVRPLVIGCGSIGSRHIENLLGLGISSVVAFDVNAERCRAVESQFRIQVTHDLREAYATNPDVVLIATPTNLHLAQALEAAEHGCDFFVEKPLTDRWDSDVERLLRIVKERGLVTMAGCNLRFHPGPAAIKRLIESSTLGRLLFLQLRGGSYLPDWHPWEDYRKTYSANASMGGGCILDGIHFIDLARWLGGEVVSVAAVVGRVGDLEVDVEDIASITLVHEGKQHSEVHLDYLQRADTRGIQAVCSEGTSIWSWPQHEVRSQRAGEKRWAVESLPSGWDLNQMYVDEMRHFLECVAIRQSTCNPVSQAARVSQIALAAKQCRQVDISVLKAFE